MLDSQNCIASLDSPGEIAYSDQARHSLRCRVLRARVYATSRPAPQRIRLKDHGKADSQYSCPTGKVSENARLPYGPLSRAEMQQRRSFPNQRLRNNPQGKDFYRHAVRPAVEGN